MWNWKATYICEQVTALDSYGLWTNGMDYDAYQAMKIHSLSDLKYFPNLYSLYLYEQSGIEDFSCVNWCQLLGNLDLRDCGITDVSFISEMPYLTYLNLENNQVTDIMPIAQQDHLYQINISGNPLNDISGLSKLKNLNSLSVNVEQMKDISVLKEFDNLIYIYRHDDVDLSALGHLTNLQNLSIEYEYRDNEYYNDRVFVTDISYLENLTNLTYLSISCLEDLSQVKYLKGLKNLQNLSLYNRKNVDAKEDADIIRDLQQALPQCNINY